jgi:uncharacterized protein (TIGR03067 family)
MDKKLPARPNLDHLRRQAKTRLAELRKSGGDRLRLADAQLVVARDTGFANWPSLAKHVQQLRALEGDWRFQTLEIDGTAIPAAMIEPSRLLIDGDRFRMESPEASYEGVFNIDVDAAPARIDIEFIEGPEAGQWSYGIYEFDGDQLTFCLGLTGASRPDAFVTSPGSGHALERLVRASTERPANVTGGTATADVARADDPAADADPDAFDVPMTPLLCRLEGEWGPTALTRDGTVMPDHWLAFGSRTATGNEVKVVFGGQVMVHARVRIDEAQTPMAIDYLNIGSGRNGAVSLGIMAWDGDEAKFLMAAPGKPRPVDFAQKPGTGLTFSQWRRK